MVSVGFLSGEKEAFDILESKLIDFESHVIQQKAQLVSITEGNAELFMMRYTRCTIT